METTLNRRSFIAGTAAFGVVGIGRAEHPQHDFDAIQKEIEALPKDVFMDFTQGVNWSEDKSKIPAAECEAMYARYPILRRYDDAFRKVVDEVRQTKVEGGRPAIWYVYNMGVIVKTRKSLFSIDLCHRLAPMIADKLDFGSSRTTTSTTIRGRSTGRWTVATRPSSRTLSATTARRFTSWTASWPVCRADIPTVNANMTSAM